MDAARLSAAKSSPMMETINMVRIYIIYSQLHILMTLGVLDSVSSCHRKECEISTLKKKA